MTANKAGLWRRATTRPAYLSEAQFAYLFLIPLVLFLLVTAVFPLVYSFWISVNTVPFSLAANEWQFVGLQNYTSAIAAPETLHALMLSGTYAVATTVLCVLVSLAGALLLNETFRGRRVLLLLSILPMALSTYATAILWRYVYAQNIGMLNAVLQHLGLIHQRIQYITPTSAIFLAAVAHTWQMAPFGVSFFLAALQVIPPDMYRVGRIDRLGPFGRFRHVTLPYLRGTLMATSVLFLIAGFKIFDLIYFLTTGGPGDASTTMTYYLYLQTFRAYNYGYGAALAYLLLAIMLVLLVVYLIFYLRQRREAGAA